jgi:two-component system, OmpR family, phosphate regulon sensor histidine kinase PhoR
MLTNSKNVSLLLALSIALINLAFLSLVRDVSASALIVSGIISFSASYILIYSVLEFFIFGEIKKIYSILDKLRKDDFSFVDHKKPGKTKNVLSRINQEIYAYAEIKQQEIDELKKAEIFRREFIADISHELKTPIFAAQGFVHTLLDGAVKDKNVRTRFLKKAAKSLDGLDRLVQDLLTISQMETGIVKMDQEKFDMYELVREVFDQFDEKADKREIKTCFSQNSVTNVNVWADRQRIYQVMVNLVSNAIKYKKEGMAIVEVHIEDLGKQVEVAVRDNGVGIPQEHIKRIFERFYRVEKSRSKDKGGSGLGLSIVKHILEAHKSTIKVYSKPGEGSEFRFILDKM